MTSAKMFMTLSVVLCALLACSNNTTFARPQFNRELDEFGGEGAIFPSAFGGSPFGGSGFGSGFGGLGSFGGLGGLNSAAGLSQLGALSGGGLGSPFGFFGGSNRR